MQRIKAVRGVLGNIDEALAHFERQGSLTEYELRTIQVYLNNLYHTVSVIISSI